MKLPRVPQVVFFLVLIIVPAVASIRASAQSREANTFDYSRIERLRWMGPGQPGTYLEYLLSRDSGPFETEHLYGGYPSGLKAGVDKALVLVNPSILAGIQTRLDRYVADLEADGYVVELYAASGGTPQDLKTFILGHSADLKGCVLVGSHPAAWYELDEWGHEEFPCDLYYMDLDGLWSDGDGDGRFDGQVSGPGDTGPEIFIGRIDASMMSGDEVSMTNHYLDKDHAYRTGGFTLPRRALTYTEDDWAMHADMRTDIRFAYAQFEDIAAPDTNRDDYLFNRVPSPDYEFIQLSCHSSAFAHYFTRGGQAWNSEIQAVNPFAVFFNLFACSSLRFTSSDFLGGSYIYDTSSTSVAVIGSTKTGSMLQFAAFYKPLGAGETFGEAFRQWFDVIAPFSGEEKAWHFGMTIAGDPFVALPEPPLFLKFPQGLPENYLPPGPENRIVFQIEPGTETYQPGTGLIHYRYDPADAFTASAVTPLGGELFEATLPGALPGDMPQYYFSAESSEGVTIYSPSDAPTYLYSFEVLLPEPLFADDFESDRGWTVENIDVQTGGWERVDPAGTGAQPEDDNSPDGSLCFVTGGGGGAMDDDDLDGGPANLISPLLDLKGMDGEISFCLWFYHSDGGTQDPLRVHLSNDGGLSWWTAMEIQHDPAWTRYVLRVSDCVTPTSQVRVRFNACDNPDDNIVEAALDDFEVRLLHEAPAFWADAYTLSASQGGTIRLSLDAGPANAFRPYLVLGSLSGTSPGIPLPGGQAVVPICWDPFTDLVLGRINTPLFLDFYAALDGSGAGEASINTGPISPSKAGKTMVYAYLLDAPFDFASNSVAIAIEP